jgi:cation transport regulator ChaB
VIRDILSNEEQDQFLNHFWDAIESRQKKIRRDDISTWTTKNTGRSFEHNGLIFS